MAEVLLETDTYDVHIDPPQTLDVEVDATAEQLLPLIDVNQKLAAANKELVSEVLPTLRGGLQTKEVTLTDIEQTITPDDGYLGLQKVIVPAKEREVKVVNRRMNEIDNLYRAEEVAEKYYRSDYAVAVALETNKVDETTSLLNADAYLTSDGDFYDSTNTHTWHDDDDEHYNRFIVCYFKVGENKSDFDISYFMANRIAIKGDLGALIISKNIGLEEIIVFDDSSVLDIQANVTFPANNTVYTQIKNIYSHSNGYILINQKIQILALEVKSIIGIDGGNKKAAIYNGTIDTAIFKYLKSVKYASISTSSKITNIELPELEEYYGSSKGYDMFDSGTPPQHLYFPKLKKIGGLIMLGSSIKSFVAPRLTEIYTSRLWQYNSSIYITKMVWGSVVSTFTINNWNGYFVKLIHFEFGADGGDGLSASENFRLWTCTGIDLASNDLVEDTDKFSTNKQQLLYNFKTYTIERLANRMGKSKLTLTIGANLYTIVTEETDTLIENTPYNEWLMAKLAEINWSLAKG